MSIKNPRNKKVVVIGAGLGGVSAAISLAADGFQVEIYEKNPHIGGKLNVYRKDGFIFDLGPSILILPHIFRQLFERAGKNINEYVQFEEVVPQWRCFFEDGAVIDLHPDIRKIETVLSRFSEKESRGFLEFLAYSRKLYTFAEETYFNRGDESFKAFFRGNSFTEVIERSDFFRTMSQGIKRYIKEPHLKAIMEYFIKYVGSSAYDAPAILNLLPYAQFGWGLWYVKGGMYNLAFGLKRLLDESGVPIYLDQEVTQIIRNGNRAEGVILKNGNRVKADVVVSNMEVIPAYERLLDENRSFMKAYKKYEPSCSGLVIHLGIDHHYPQLHHHCFFFSKNQKRHFQTVFRQKRMPDDPTIYLVAPCVTDRGLAPEGYDILKILPHIPHLQEKPFTTADYQALKERIYDKLERMGLTDLRKHIVIEHVLTPHDIQDMYFSNRGSIYGVVAHRFKNFGLKAPRKSKKYKNLYFVGGSVNPGAGMCMVALGGQQVRKQILRDLC
jgi:diapolycopene oxygenase